ncbi:MAG: MMPL family transporter [Rhodocyclaceae bacterium]|nr:MMPL family transporter [Rhodocyclaceae bacterium]
MSRLLRPAVVVWLLALIGSLAVIANTHFTADMSAFLPRHPTEQQSLLVDQLKEGTLSRTLLIGIEGSDPAGRAKLSRGLTRALMQSELIATANNGSDESSAQERELLFRHRYLLSPAVTPEHFSVEGLRESIANSIDMLASPVGVLLKKLLPRDPTGEIMQLFSALGGGSMPNSQFGVWASQDGQRALLMVQTRAAGSDTDGQEAAINAVRLAFAEAAEQSAIDDAKIELSGAPVFAVEARATIKSEIRRLAVISALGTIALLGFAYRSATAIMFGLLPVLSGALAGIAAVSLGFGSVHGITIGFGTTLIGEAVDYTIYYFVQSSSADGDRAQRWIERFWPTIRLGVLTSICGFAALLGSGFPGLAQLGLYSIVGLITAAAITRYVLPIICPAGIGQRPLGNGGLGKRATAGLMHLNRLGAQGRGNWIVIGLALCAAAVIFQARDRLWDDRLSGLSPIPPAAQALDQKLRSDLGAPDLRYLVIIRRHGQEAALAASEEAGRVLDRLVDANVIAGYNSAARFLPSQASQQQRRDALPERAELQRNLNEAVRSLPLSASRLGGFVDDVAAARTAPLLDRDQFQGSSLAMLIDSLLMHRKTATGEEWTALLPLRAAAGQDIDPSRIQAALAAANIEGALCLDLAGESAQLYSAYLHEVILLSCAGLAAIAVLLTIALRSPRRMLHVLAPLLATVLIVIAGLSLAGIKLTLLHLIGVLLIFAVGSNYALFFDRPAGEAQAPLDTATLSSLLLANMATLIGFGALALAKVPVLNAIGVTVGPGAVLALLLAALLAKS